MEYTEIIENLTEYVVINVNSSVGILSKIYKDYKDSNIQPDISEIKMAMQFLTKFDNLKLDDDTELKAITDEISMRDSWDFVPIPDDLMDSIIMA